MPHTTAYRFHVAQHTVFGVNPLRVLGQVLATAFLIFLPLTGGSEELEPAQVMLFGVFHFANPGLDVIKTDQINVMTEENQAYLEELTTRIAAKSAAETVHGFDERAVQWAAEPLFAYLGESDPETSARVNEMIASFTAESQEAHETLSLRELLLHHNSAEAERENRALYILTNHAGDGDNFVGADATASWWHRNFRMYAIVQRHALPGERVLVIGGQGHIAVLRRLLEDDVDRQAVDVTPYL